MLAGAVAVILTGEITPEKALVSINSEVMIFLFGMFIIGEAVSASGILAQVSDYICQTARTPDQMLFLFIGLMAAASAVLMNDTVAIIGTPLALALARRYHIHSRIMLLVLCFALTTGSVPSPIGNPQNLLITTYWHPENPFLSFASGLLIPTLLCLGLIFIFMRCKCRENDGTAYSVPVTLQIQDFRFYIATILSLVTLCMFLAIRIIGISSEINRIPLGIIALFAALPVLIVAKQRVILIQRIDWRTLIFFAAMFVLMQSVYDSGYFQSSVSFGDLTTVPLILTMSILLSQFISNVPFIALFQPVITASGISVASMLALSAGSTIAGNLTILGAASNVIVIQQAEIAGVVISSRDFLKVGIPLTLLQSTVYAIWLLYFT